MGLRRRVSLICQAVFHILVALPVGASRLPGQAEAVDREGVKAVGDGISSLYFGQLGLNTKHNFFSTVPTTGICEGAVEVKVSCPCISVWEIVPTAEREFALDVSITPFENGEMTGKTIAILCDKKVIGVQHLTGEVMEILSFDSEIVRLRKKTEAEIPIAYKALDGLRFEGTSFVSDRGLYVVNVVPQDEAPPLLLLQSSGRGGIPRGQADLVDVAFTYQGAEGSKSLLIKRTLGNLGDVSPSVIFWGRMAVSESRIKTVTVTVDKGVTVELVSDSSELEVDERGTEAHNVFTLTYTPDSSGTKSGKVRVVLSRQDSEETDVIEIPYFSDVVASHPNGS